MYMLNNNKYREHLIEKYFDNDLNKEEEIDFNNLMKNDENFYNYIKFEKHIRESINNRNINYFRDNIIDLDIPSIYKKKYISKKNYWKFIIVFLLILSIFSIYNLYNNYNNIDYIYNKHYEYSKISILRNQDKNDINVFSGIINYHQGNYYKSIQDFKKVIKKDIDNIYSRFYIGISYMEIGNFDKASYNFKYVIKNNDNLYIEHSKWYLGLCYLKQNKIKRSIKQFKEISDDDGNYYQEKSNKILKEIKIYEIFKKI